MSEAGFRLIANRTGRVVPYQDESAIPKLAKCVLVYEPDRTVADRSVPWHSRRPRFRFLRVALYLLGGFVIIQKPEQDLLLLPSQPPTHPWAIVERRSRTTPTRLP